jgi:hypothetical protein
VKTDTAVLESIHRQQEKKMLQLFPQLARINYVCACTCVYMHILDKVTHVCACTCVYMHISDKVTRETLLLACI